MLEASGLAFRYAKSDPWLFRGIDIRIAPGEIVGLPGPSGRGKSTLAKILGGYLRPVEGNVLVNGHHLPDGEFCPVQLLFQHPELAVNPRWKIADILREAGEPDRAMLDVLGVDPTWNHRYPHELSGGELQRVCLARALDRRTRYLLCDEMTSMLDAQTQAGIWKAVLRAVREHGLGLLVISHDHALLSGLCQRTVSLFDS
ncbi:MAG: ATP-binding cassette domain-containing protein [Proteobacteria bacterium]|nr:ATP-binding cassette domain-containing protein [Pseudomonadota bacterium]